MQFSVIPKPSVFGGLTSLQEIQAVYSKPHQHQRNTNHCICFFVVFFFFFFFFCEGECSSGDMNLHSQFVIAELRIYLVHCLNEKLLAKTLFNFEYLLYS